MDVEIIIHVGERHCNDQGDISWTDLLTKHLLITSTRKVLDPIGIRSIAREVKDKVEFEVAEMVNKYWTSE